MSMPALLAALRTHRVYTLLDVLAVAQLQALVLNWSLMRKFGSLRQVRAAQEANLVV